MATVHPSRMGLVPQDSKDVYSDFHRARSRSPSHKYDRDRRETDREREKARDRESDNDSQGGRGGGSERERPDHRRDRRRGHNDDRTSPRRRDNGRWVDDRDRDRDRGRHRERERGKDKDRSRSRRRASPEYGEYKRPTSPGPGTPSMYPSRQPQDGMYQRRSGYGGGGSEYLERCATFPSLCRVDLCAEIRFIAGGRRGKVQH